MQKWIGEHLRQEQFGDMKLFLSGTGIPGRHLYCDLDVDLMMAVTMIGAKLDLNGWDQPGRRTMLSREFSVAEDKVRVWARLATQDELIERLEQLEERARGKLDARGIDVPAR